MATYSLLDVVGTLSGPTGSVNIGSDAGISDEGITIEAAGDKNTMTVGGGGAVQHSLHADKSGRAVIRLLKTSPINAQLQQMYDIQTTTAALHGQNTLVVQQKAAGDVHTGRQVAFKKKSNISYQKEAGFMDWEFDVGMIDSILGTYPTS